MIRKSEGNAVQQETNTSSSGEGSGVVAFDMPQESYTQKCIRRSGALQAAVGSNIVAAYSTSFEDAKLKAVELAEFMLKWIEQR